MSDGPHRSLNMRRGWKRVAELADNPASGPEDVRDAAEPALNQDWESDVPEALSKGICDVLDERQETLFPREKIPELEALRPMAVGHDLGQVFLDCAIKQAAGGYSGPEAALTAVVEAISIWCARHARQIEEHYLRESTRRRADRVLYQIEDALSSSCDTELARKLLRLDNERPLRIAPKKSGLDDGVKL